MLLSIFVMCLGTSLSTAASSQAVSQALSYQTESSAKVKDIATSTHSGNYSAQETSSTSTESILKKEINLLSINSISNVQSHDKLQVGSTKITSVARKGAPLLTATPHLMHSSANLESNETSGDYFPRKPSSVLPELPEKETHLHSKDDNIVNANSVENVEEIIPKIDSTHTSGSIARKGTPIEILNESEGAVKLKPTASWMDQTDLNTDSIQYDKSSLIIGLSLGILLVLALGYVTFWRLHDVWAKRQYKRVDFLVDGMYVDA